MKIEIRFSWNWCKHVVGTIKDLKNEVAWNWVFRLGLDFLKNRRPVTLIWNARYCPTNTTQANPYKSRGSGYPVDPSVWIRATFIWVHQGPPVIVLIFFSYIGYYIEFSNMESKPNFAKVHGPWWTQIKVYTKGYWIPRTLAFVWVCLDCICWTISSNWDHCAIHAAV